MNTAVAPVFNKKRAWLVTIVQVFASVTYGMMIYRGMTTAYLIVSYFNIDYATYGALTGVVGMFTLVSGIPGGILMGKLGARGVFVGCMGIGVIGSILPLSLILLFDVDFVVFMWSGVLGSIGYGALSVAGPMFVSGWYPPQKRSLPMACCGLFAPFAMLIILLTSTPLIEIAGAAPTEEIAAITGGYNPAGWIYVAVFGAILLLIGFILSLIFLKMPKEENNFLTVTAASEASQTSAPIEQDSKSQKAWRAFTSPSIWMIIIIFSAFGWSSASFASYWPTYVASGTEFGGFGIAPADANIMSSVSTYFMIAAALIFGWALTKINHKHWGFIIFIIAILVAICDIFMYQLPAAVFCWPFLIIYGCTQNLCPCATFTMLPELCDNPKMFSWALGFLTFISNLIGTVSNALNGYLREAYTSWNALGIPMTVLAVMALIAGVVMIFLWKKRWNAMTGKVA